MTRLESSGVQLGRETQIGDLVARLSTLRAHIDAALVELASTDRPRLAATAKVSKVVAREPQPTSAASLQGAISDLGVIGFMLGLHEDQEPAGPQG